MTPNKILFLGLASCLLSYAHADTLLTTHGNLLAVTDQPVPGPSGALRPADTVIADDGPSCSAKCMVATCRATGTSGAFRNTTAADLSMMIRSSDQPRGGSMLVNDAGNNGIRRGPC
jgi:hypothetical protein